MGAARWSVERLETEIARLGARGLPIDDFFAELAARMRRVIASDASCWHTLDPHTRLLTSDAPRELVERGIFDERSVIAAGELLIRSEYLVEDANTFASLASRRVPVATLEQATGGRPERSTRYRELLAPAGIPHELRAALTFRGRVWGAVHVARHEGSGPFTDRDVAALAQVGGAIAQGIRGSLRFDAARRATGAEPPGLIVLDRLGEVELVTEPAHELLAVLRNSGDGSSLPSSVVALASFTRREGVSGDAVTVPSAEGWITLHASLESPGEGRVAIVIERARGLQAAALRLETRGVTPREREVATLLARGLSNAEIADALVLSPHTVQDHVKSIYAKVGVSSRQELVGRVFLDEYLPEVLAHTPLTSRGRFEQSEVA